MSEPPKIVGFRGLLYNTSKVSLADVVTPPYDVISPEMQKEFYERSPHNFVRVDLAREPCELRYANAQKTFREWLAQQIMVRDEKPALYFHHHTFDLPDGKKVTRKGFFGLRRLEDFAEGGIKPHEKTLEGPKNDRLQLMRALSAQLSPVFSLYSDIGHQIERLAAKLKGLPAEIDFTTREGERHQVWKEVNGVVLRFVDDILKDEPLLIADGHHRYETALNYRNECRDQSPPGTGFEAFNYVLMYFSNRNDEGLVILPIHRALHHLGDFELADFVRSLQKYFRLTPLTATDPQELLAILAREGEEAHAFVLVTNDPKRSYLLTMSRRGWRQSPVTATVSPSVVGLDVTVLHRLVFEEILRMSSDRQAKQENIIYWKDTQKAIDETRNGSCEVTFLLNPTRIEDMEKVALAGDKMPQKSTYFYPKVPSGLVVYSME